MEFKSEWLTDPEFEVWLSGVPGDDFAFCKLCNKEIGISNGKGSLRAHDRGNKHRQLVREARNRIKRLTKQSKPRSTVTSSTTIPHRQTYGSSTAGITLSIVNNAHYPSAVPRFYQNSPSHASTSGHQHVSNVSDFLGFSSSQCALRSSSPPRETTWFEIKIDDIFSRQDSMIVSNCFDLLELYGDAIGSGDRKRSIKDILDDYVAQHKNLRSRIRKRITEALHRW